MNTLEEEIVPPSKTRRKQEMEDLQALGEELVALSSERVNRVSIPDDLRDAVRDAQRMTRRDEARRRQMQYIGRLMRNVEVEPIRAALAQVRGESADETARLHRLERLRDDFIADEKAVQDILARYPTADLQHLRALRRAALKEQAQQKPPRSYRALFQQLKALDTDEAPADSASAEDEESS